MFKCKYCSKSFTRKRSLAYHIDNNVCCMKDTEILTDKINIKDEDLYAFISELLPKLSKSDLNKLSHRINEISNSKNENGTIQNNIIQKSFPTIVSGNSNTVNIANTNTDTNNNIINNINNEDTSALQDNKEVYDEFKTKLGKPEGTFKRLQRYNPEARARAFISLYKIIHCNKDYPQNHNIYVTNERARKYMVFDQNKWRDVFFKDGNEYLRNQYIKIYKEYFDVLFEIGADILDEDGINFENLKQLNHRSIIDKVYIAIPSINKNEINIITKKLNNYFFDNV